MHPAPNYFDRSAIPVECRVNQVLVVRRYPEGVEDIQTVEHLDHAFGRLVDVAVTNEAVNSAQVQVLGVNVGDPIHGIADAG